MIITALENESINNSLKEIYKDKVYIYDFSQKEDVISFIEKYTRENNDNDITLITKEGLSGNINSKDYLKQIKNISSDIRIIYILKELEDDMKVFLFSLDILDIIVGSYINMEEIKEILDSNNKIVYKHSNNCENLSVHEEAVKYVEKSIVLKKEIFAIYGTSGAGKSFFSTILAKKLSKKLNINVALLDMDTQNPSIDILSNVDGNSNVLSQVVESVDKRSEISDIISKYMIKDKNNKNLSYMTSNVSLFECQNKLSNKYYSKIYSSISQKYDYAIIDLPSSPFLDVVSYTLMQATKIFFVINANYVSIRQALKYLNLITKLWNIDTSQIGIIVNKYKKNSLDALQIQNLMPEYKIICTLNYDDNLEAYINGSTSNYKVDLDMDKILKWLNIDKKDNKISKPEIFKYKLLRGKEGV